MLQFSSRCRFVLKRDPTLSEFHRLSSRKYSKFCQFAENLTKKWKNWTRGRIELDLSWIKLASQDKNTSYLRIRLNLRSDLLPRSHTSAGASHETYFSRPLKGRGAAGVRRRRCAEAVDLGLRGVGRALVSLQGLDLL